MLRQVRQSGLESVWDAVGIGFVDRGRSTMVGNLTWSLFGYGTTRIADGYECMSMSRFFWNERRAARAGVVVRMWWVQPSSTIC